MSSKSYREDLGLTFITLYDIHVIGQTSANMMNTSKTKHPILSICSIRHEMMMMMIIWKHLMKTDGKSATSVKNIDKNEAEQVKHKSV